MSDHHDPLPFDDLELGDDVDSAHLDRLIRRRLDGVMDRPAAAPAVLDDLRRPLRRARRLHQTQLVVSAAAVLALVAGASQLVAGRPTESTLVAAGQTNAGEASTMAATSMATIDPLAPATTPLGFGSTVADTVGSDGVVSTDNAVAGGTEGATTADPTTAYGSASTVTTSPGGASSPATAGTSATTAAPPTSATPSTTAAKSPTTTTATPGSTTARPRTTSTTASPTSGTITSACGTVTATATGSTITLVGTQPRNGFSSNVANDGPEELEVAMTGAQGSCEIKAKALGGVISSATTYEPSSSDTEHDD